MKVGSEDGCVRADSYFRPSHLYQWIVDVMEWKGGPPLSTLATQCRASLLKDYIRFSC